MEKHTTWIAYLWGVIMSFLGHITLEEYATAAGIAGIVATFFLNRHYRRREVEIETERLEVMRRYNQARLKAIQQRNQILEHLAKHPNSAVNRYVAVDEALETEDAEEDSKPA